MIAIVIAGNYCLKPKPGRYFLGVLGWKQQSSSSGDPDGEKRQETTFRSLQMEGVGMDQLMEVFSSKWELREE